MKDFFKNKYVLYGGILFIVIVISVAVMISVSKSKSSSMNSDLNPPSKSKVLKSKSKLDSSVANASDTPKVKQPDKRETNSTKSSSSGHSSDQTSLVAGSNELILPKGVSNSKDGVSENGLASTPADNVKSDANVDSEKGVFSPDSVKDQSNLVDSNPDYIKVNKDNVKQSEISNLTIKDLSFIKSNLNLLVSIKLKEPPVTFNLVEPADWSQFKSALGLSDSDYLKVVKYFNTVKKFRADNKIEFNGFGS